VKEKRIGARAPALHLHRTGLPYFVSSASSFLSVVCVRVISVARGVVRA